MAKTAISIDDSLFAEAEKLAREMDVSRSRLFSLALEEFVRRRQSGRMLAQINAAYEDEPDADEAELPRRMRGSHRRIVEGEW